ncbi:MAG: nucleotide exchange factor GrpE, partial [Methylococcales bacterium]|nr:nucleotide exchange factor GrpE [Methylococcales bacterium]
MSNDQELPETQIEVEAESEQAEDSHTEVAEHEYTVEELKQELEDTKQKAHEAWDKAVRTQAEMENLKRRTQKDLEDTHKFALTNFGKELLPVFDSVVLGLQAATGESEEVKKFREGSELTIKQFEALFAKFNILAVDPIGQPFNA